MLTLPSRIEAAAQRGRGTITFLQGDDAEAVTWADLHADARGMAAALQARGIGPGDHVALLGPTSRPLVTAIQATWLAGATVMLLPLPMRMGSIEEFVDQTRARLHHSDAALVLLDEQLAPFIEARPDDPPLVPLTELRADGGAFVAPHIDPERLAVLQFTSGSTSDPKGVMLPHRALCANLDAIIGATDFDPDDDVLLSWLPLYHDMGLVGMLTLPMSTGGDLALAGPQDFMASPARWVRWMSEFGATATAGPNFAWVLATRAMRRLDGLDLSRMRVALNGAEPVDAEAMDALVEAGAPHGLDAGALFPAFGMAEVCIAGAFPRPGQGLRTDVVDARVLETERYAAPVADEDEGGRRLALLGRPVPGLEMRVVDPETGAPRHDREVGELEIRGSSVTTGYYQRPDLSDATFRDGWLRTGDLAYLVDGELVLCGRIKDMIIVGGRNVFPQDVEKAVGEVAGVRPGNVVAIGVTGRRGAEEVVVVAEVRDEIPAALRDHVAERVRTSVGLAPRDVVLVAAGTLPKTSSGKLQRSLCRDKYLAADLVGVAPA
ncbi:fatty acyl-AMP ligase [Iamia majanohamensis]|uniref:Fatty acyl-AMP ligase n=1 Tax=Iamia majanohamensis TaxID=467976 RepID=A0AAF0BXM3_9ACTN|nr:fatty acyl-AMP ligase [Iamia majanohamensis]WCO68919.1 fatty acyl-AMP ligase [Iamia majanohamensis]